MLFAATLDHNVDLLVRRYLTDPFVHSVEPLGRRGHDDGAPRPARPRCRQAADDEEIAARDGRVIMFLDTKHAVDRLTEHLLSNGVRAAALHGGKSQPQRTRTLTQFKTGHVTVLVATDVAARGIHVDDLDLIGNVDPTTDHKDYLHRGSRTARAGGRVRRRRHPGHAQSTSRDDASDGGRGHHRAHHPGPLRRGSPEPDHRRPDSLRHPGRLTAPVAERGARSTASRGRRSHASGARRVAVRQPAFDATA